MPQAATLPTHAHTPRRTRADRRTVPIEERVSVLETRAEAIATVADVRGAENRMILWILSAALALAGFSFAILSGSESRMDKRMDALETGMNKRMDALETRIDKLDTRVDKLDAKIEQSVARLDGRIDKLDTKLDAILAELVRQRRSAE